MAALRLTYDAPCTRQKKLHFERVSLILFNETQSPNIPWLPQSATVALVLRFATPADNHFWIFFQVDPQQLLDESEAVLSDLWGDARLLPGALRLLQHVRSHNLRAAIATSTPRSTFDKKMAKKPFLRDLVEAVVCGNEVSLEVGSVVRGQQEPAHSILVDAPTSNACNTSY